MLRKPIIILIKFVCFVINIVCILVKVYFIIKIKYMNLGRINDICNKVNFTTKLYIFYI